MSVKSRSVNRLTVNHSQELMNGEDEILAQSQAPMLSKRGHSDEKIEKLDLIFTDSYM